MLDDVLTAFDHADADDSISAVLASMNRPLALVCLMIDSAKTLVQKFMSPEPLSRTATGKIAKRQMKGETIEALELNPLGIL